MNIYKINVEHAAPKNSWTNIECFLLAEDEESVYQWLDEKESGCWSDRGNEDGLIDIYDEDYNVIGQESYKEKMLRIKGEINDDDRSFDDAYYGLTFYGWELVEFPNIEDAIKILDSAEILVRVTKEG